MGYEPKTHVTGRNFINGIFRSKFVMVEMGDAYFFAADSHGGAYSSTYTGLYAPIDLPQEAECSIFRKEWFDRILVSGKFKTGVDYIDKSLTVKSSGWNPAELLDADKVDKFLKISSRIKPLKLLIRNDYLEYLVPLKGQKVIGLETNRWLFYQKDVTDFLEGATELIDSFRAAAR